MENQILMTQEKYLPQLEIAGRIMVILYFIGIIIFPLYFSRIQFTSIIYTTDLFFIIISSVVLYKIISKKITLHIPMLIVYIGVILLYSSFELILGIIYYNNPLYSLRQFAPFLYLLFIPISYYLYDTTKQINLLLQTIFISSMLVASIYLLFGIEISAYTYVSLGIAIAIAAYLYNNSKNKILIYLSFYIILIALFAIPTRGGWISIIISIIFGVIAAKIFIKQHFWGNSTKGVIIIAITAFSCIIISYLYSSSILKNYIKESSTSANIESRWAYILHLYTSDKELISTENNARWRLLVWEDMIADWQKKPILGYGFGNKFFSPTINKLEWAGSQNDKSIWEGKNIGLEPHNSHIHVLYMEGLIGFVLFEGFFLLVFIKFIKNILNSASLDKKILYLSLLGGILYMWVISMFGNIIEPPYSVMLLWLLVGVLFASEKIPENQQD